VNQICLRLHGVLPSYSPYVNCGPLVRSLEACFIFRPNKLGLVATITLGCVLMSSLVENNIGP